MRNYTNATNPCNVASLYQQQKNDKSPVEYNNNLYTKVWLWSVNAFGHRPLHLYDWNCQIMKRKHAMHRQKRPTKHSIVNWQDCPLYAKRYAWWSLPNRNRRSHHLYVCRHVRDVNQSAAHHRLPHQILCDFSLLRNC